MEIGQSIWISVENLACFYIAILLVINVLFNEILYMM